MKVEKLPDAVAGTNDILLDGDGGATDLPVCRLSLSGTWQGSLKS